MNDLNFQFLGDLTVTRQGEALNLPPSKKTRALLAYLALSPRRLRREFLSELLWEVPDDPRGSLRWSLSKIRRLVDDEQHTRVIADRSHVAMDCSAVSIDSVELLQLQKQSLDDISESELRQAAERYDGIFLDGLDLPNFHEFYSWCVAQREEVKQAQIAILKALVGRLDTEAALPYCQKLCLLTPYDQAARAQLISLLNQLGRLQEAQAQYQQGIKLLKEARLDDDGQLYRALHATPVAQTQSDPGSSITPSATATKEEATATAPPATSASGSAAPAGATTRLPQRFAAQLIGREQELQQITAALQHSPADQRALVLLLRGEPGIGKSHLLNTAAAMAREAGAAVLKAKAFASERLRPFALWNDALRRYLTEERTAELLASHERVSRELMFDTLSRVLQQQCSQRPLVVLLDDIQWCDESSASALHYVLRMNHRQPVVVLCAAREMELRDNPALQQALHGLRQEHMLQELAIDSLPPEQLEALIQQQCPGTNAAKLSQECNGNPLLALQLARAELDGGIASSLHELVQERLSRLQADAKLVLDWAAVLAPRINLPTLEKVTKLQRELIENAIEQAEKQGILLPSERGFRFFHDLISQCIYEAIPPAKRQTMHHRVAELLEADSSLDLQLASDLAYHATRSGDPQLACRAIIAAARLCLRFYAHDDALQLYQQGMDFSAQLSELDRICTQIELSDIRISAAPIEDWQAAAEALTELAEQALDYGALAFARMGYQQASYLRWVHGQWKQAMSDSLQGERVTRAGSDSSQIVGLAEAAKCLALLEKDLSKADAMVMEAQALASRQNFSCVAIPVCLGMLRYYEGNLHSAHEYLEEARALSKSLGDRISEFMANEYLANLQIEQGDFQAAERYGKALLDIGSRLPEGSELPFARGLNALCSYARDGNDAMLEEPLQHLRDADAKHRLSYLLNRCSQLDLAAQQWRKAATRANEALQLAQTMHRPSEMMLAHSNLAQALEQLGDSAAETHLDAVQELLSDPVGHWARQRAATLIEQKSEGMES